MVLFSTFSWSTHGELEMISAGAEDRRVLRRDSVAVLTLGDQSWCHQRQFLRTVYPRILKRGDGKYKTYHHMGQNNFLRILILSV